jgi:hypothetical protein
VLNDFGFFQRGISLSLVFCKYRPTFAARKGQPIFIERAARKEL